MASEVEVGILEEFMEKHSDDLLSPEKCELMFRELKERKDFIEAQLDIENEESTVSRTLCRIDKSIEEVKATTEKCDAVSGEIEKDLDEVDEIRKVMEEKMTALHTLQSALQYVNVVIRIESLSAELEMEFANKDDERCATVFANLCEISRNLSETKARNLREFLKDTLVYWHDVLKDKLVKDFDEILKTIKWPFVNANFSLASPSAGSIQRLQIVAEYLLQIELPEESVVRGITSALLSDFPPLCLPMHCLVLPLRKRFLYHFFGGRQTNRVDKPEWYFTQILSWVRDHVDFVEKWIQPIIDRLGLHHIDAKLELMRGLVQLAVEKLHSELPNLQYDDFTFSHSVDEALGFDKELRETYRYPSSQPSILTVLTQGQVFFKWIAMEKKYAIEKMDLMFSPGAIADAFQTTSSEEEEYKITSCADTFVTLLQTITERYESLPRPGHRLQFLELQLELLDDFRVRLLQLVSAEEGDVVESRIPMIANTVYYVENVLIDWGSMLHYLNLYHYKTQMENVEANNPEVDPARIGLELESETVFADTLSLYRHMRKDLLCTLSESVFHEAKSRSKNYKRERWTEMSKFKDARSMSLTPSACPVFEVLAKRLHQLQKSLARALFTTVWRYVARELDGHLFEELVLENRFNDGGAGQLKHDVTRNLFPLFSQFSEKPENYFTQLKESCELLNITKGSALLLRETLLALEGATGVEDRRKPALKEVGVVHFSPQMAVQILNRRADITVNRMTID